MQSYIYICVCREIEGDTNDETMVNSSIRSPATNGQNYDIHAEVEN